MFEYASCLAYTLAGICYLYFGFRYETASLRRKQIAFLVLAFAYLMLGADSLPLNH